MNSPATAAMKRMASPRGLTVTAFPRGLPASDETTFPPCGKVARRAGRGGLRSPTEIAPNQSPTARSAPGGERLQQRRRQRVEHQHGLGLLQRPAQFPVVLRRADPRQARSTGCNTPECCPARPGSDGKPRAWRAGSWDTAQLGVGPSASSRRLFSGQKFSCAWIRGGTG